MVPVVMPVVKALPVMQRVNVVLVMLMARVLWLRAPGGGEADDTSSRLLVVIVRVLWVSPRMLVPLVTPMVRAPQVSHAPGVNVAGGADGERVAGGVTVAGGVDDVDGDVDAGSGCGSARGRLLACCGCCCPVCLLVLAVFVGSWSCRCWVAPRRSWWSAPLVMSLVGVLQVMQWYPW